MQRYEEAFGEKVFRPAYSVCGTEKITSTAYLPLASGRARLLTLYTSIDGTRVLSRSSAETWKPAGAFKSLVAIVKYPGTFTDSALDLWEQAQRNISADYATFTASRGQGNPIITFEHTNVLLDASELTDASSLSAAQSAVQRHGQSLSGYNFFILLNLDPTKSEGGYSAMEASFPASIYMGNFSSFRAPLTAANMTSIAGAIYYHEVSHNFGWPADHSWRTPACPGPPGNGYDGGLSRWLPPVLFGWEDVDGDGIPEIVDSTPYGRSR